MHDRNPRSWSWRIAAIVAAVAAFMLPAAGSAGAANAKDVVAYVPSALLASAEAHPKQSFDVIVQGTSNAATPDVAADVAAAVGLDGEAPAWGKRFQSIPAV
jgi:hypothetical protein